jgi:hypothetical protein
MGNCGKLWLTRYQQFQSEEAQFAHQQENSVEEVEWYITRFAVLAGMCWLHVQSALLQQA